MDTEEDTERKHQTAEVDKETGDKIFKYELIEAASEGDLSVFKKYEARKDDPSIFDYNKRTPLHLAAAENQLEVVKYLIEEWKVDPTATDRWGKTAYDEAVRAKNFEVEDYLGAVMKVDTEETGTERRVQSAENGRQTADKFVKYELIEAAAKGDLSMFKKYEAHKGDPNIFDYDKRTPLHLAAVENKIEVVKYLVEEWKVDLTATDRWGKTAYDEATRAENFEVADYLKSAQSTSRRKLNAQQYEIINAASEGNLAELKRYRHVDAKMDFFDYDLRTPLHLAAAEGHADVVEFLIKDCDVDAEVKDRWGNTPRDEARRFNHTELANKIEKLNEDQIYHRIKEIEKSDKMDYEQTLKEETTTSHCIRIDIVGHSLAGKTSLAKRLLEQGIESVKPTNSIDTHLYEVYATEKGGWKMLKDSSVYEDCYARSIAYSEPKKHPAVQKIVDQVDEKHREKPLLKRQAADIANFSRKKKARTDGSSVPTFINIWDFGGQAVFYATHQLFYSPNSIYLLVIDLSEIVKDRSQNEFHPDVKTIEDICLDWINTIFAYTGSKERKPSIFLVGTHKDRMKELSDDCKEEMANRFFNKIREHSGKDIKDIIQSQTFFIDNTDSTDHETENLKRAILKYAKENTNFERIPKRWIPLENILRTMKNENYAKFKRIQAENENSLVPIDTEEKLRDFLAYLHRQGSIVHFQDLKLSNHVILNPQWLIDAYKSIFTNEENFNGTEKDHAMLIGSAKISSKVFEDIWKENEAFYKHRYILLEFLEHFRVIVRPKNEIEDKSASEDNPVEDKVEGRDSFEDEDFFYVPSLLKKKSDVDIEHILLSNPEKSIMRKSIPLQFVINNPRMPSWQYNSIVSAIITKWPILKHHGQRQLFVSKCVVKLPRENQGDIEAKRVESHPVINHYGSIKKLDKSENVIEIQVFGIATYTSPEEMEKAKKVGSFEINFRKCDQFRRFVEKALRDCLERFLVDSSDKYDVCVPQGPNSMFSIKIKKIIQCWFADSVESIEDSKWSKRIKERELSKVTSALGRNWEILCLSLGVQQIQLDRINDSREPVAVRMFRALNEWRKQNRDKATWDVLITELRKNPTVSCEMDVIKTIMEES